MSLLMAAVPLPLPLLVGCRKGLSSDPSCLSYILCSATDLSLLMFADDTNMFATGYCPITLAASVNANLDRISQWFSANLHSLNLSKTSYMIFSKKKLLNTNLTISLRGEHLNRVIETKFLGLTLTEDLK